MFVLRDERLSGSEKFVERERIRGLMLLVAEAAITKRDNPSINNSHLVDEIMRSQSGHPH